MLPKSYLSLQLLDGLLRPLQSLLCKRRVHAWQFRQLLLLLLWMLHLLRNLVALQRLMPMLQLWLRLLQVMLST